MTRREEMLHQSRERMGAKQYDEPRVAGVGAGDSEKAGAGVAVEEVPVRASEEVQGCVLAEEKALGQAMRGGKVRWAGGDDMASHTEPDEDEDVQGTFEGDDRDWRETMAEESVQVLQVVACDAEVGPAGNDMQDRHLCGG